jgi:preprotein translocase subunit YajC
MELLLPLIVLAGLYVIMFFLPQRREKKRIADMRNSIKIGDSITTIGGIIGKVAHVEPGNIVIESGEDQVRFSIATWAVRHVGTDIPGDAQ